jgi:hypothetical protein
MAVGTTGNSVLHELTVMIVSMTAGTVVWNTAEFLRYQPRLIGTEMA